MKDFRLYQKPKQIIFTQDGFDDVQKKYDELKAERPSAVENLRKARELGDLSENGFYKASRQRLSFIDSQLLRLGHQLKYGVVKSASQTEVVELGSKVTLQTGNDVVIYTIVGVHEANPSEGRFRSYHRLGASW
jgi:transcription elongation factor GreA